MSSRIIYPCIRHLTKMLPLLKCCLLHPPCMDCPNPVDGGRGGIQPSSKEKKSAQFPNHKIPPYEISLFNTSIICSCSHYCCIIFLQAKSPTPFSNFQSYLENSALIISCFPYYSFPFFISNFIDFF